MMHQGITIDYLNRLHNDLSKEQLNLVEEMKITTTIEKEKSYIQLQSKSITNKNKIFLFLRIFVEFPLAFIKYYIIRRHFTGALTGLITALILAYYRLKRVIVLFKN